VAQIAGRAGRGMRDGTFGTTGGCAPIDQELADAVEGHRFEALEQIAWRNSDLDFTHVDRLLDSLQAPPPGPGLVRGRDASDLETFAALAREDDMRKLAQGRRMVRTLWEACQIPDFRKLADDSHVRLCARIFGHVVRDGAIPTDWIAGQIAALARADGDIDTLMQRLSGVRVWTYIAARGDWVRDAAHWQARAREVEDLLSDALHERLTSRFVDRRAAHLMRRLEAGDGDELLSAVTRRGEVVVEGHPVGHVAGFGFVPDPLAVGDERRLVLRAARRALRDEMPRRVSRLEAAPDTALAWLPSHRIAWDGTPIARLRPGATALRPQVEVMDSEFLDGPARERVRQRLQRFIDAEIGETLAPLLALAAADAADPLLRGPLHRLVEGIGVVAGGFAEQLPPPQRARLKAFGVRAGRHALFMPAALKPRAAARRASLWALAHGVAVPSLPGPGLVALREPADWPPGFAAAMGWVAAGPLLLRLDIVERVAAELAWSSRFRAVPIPGDLAARLSVKADLLPAVLRGLGFQLLPAAPLAADQFGPPSPPLMAPQRRRRPPPAIVLPVRDGPFAALAALRLGA
jgi:ATP-dependent RNA helicase SUPV3L1/SUV3